MPSWIELRLAVQGLLRLARFNSDFTRFFDHSPRGALRSFWVALPLLPYSVAVVFSSGLTAHVENPAQFTVVMLICYVYLWLLPPAILTWVAPVIGRQAELSGCIAMYNWLGLLTAGLGLPFLLLAFAGVPPDIMNVLEYGLLAVQLIWEAFLLMHALRLALWQAGVAAVVDFVVMQRFVIPIFVLASGAVPPAS